jgi:hypothetical protein
MIRSMRRMGLGLLLALMPLTNPTVAAGAFDGSYRGAPRETKNNNGGLCRAMLRDKTPVVITNSVIKYHWVGQIPIETTVSNDGSFSVDRSGLESRESPGGSISFKGQIRGGNLEADVGNDQCAAHLSYRQL